LYGALAGTSYDTNTAGWLKDGNGNFIPTPGLYRGNAQSYVQKDLDGTRTTVINPRRENSWRNPSTAPVKVPYAPFSGQNEYESRGTRSRKPIPAHLGAGGTAQHNYSLMSHGGRPITNQNAFFEGGRPKRRRGPSRYAIKSSIAAGLARGIANSRMRQSRARMISKARNVVYPSMLKLY